MSNDMRNLMRILLVAFLLLLLMCIVLPRGAGRERLHLKAAKTNVAALKTALSMFQHDCGRYPSTAEGLGALLKRPVAIPQGVNWRGPYVDARMLPKDRWAASFLKPPSYRK